MFGELKDIDSARRVADLPLTVNYNNKTIKEEFDYLFDSSNNYFRQSLYAPRGYVKAHWGDFVNLRVDNLKVGTLTIDASGMVNGSGSDGLSNFGQPVHNDSLYRFYWEMPVESKPEKNVNNFAHDASMIVSFADAENPIVFGDRTYDYPISLREELNALEQTVDSLAKNITIKLSDDEIYQERDESYAEGSDDIEVEMVNLTASDTNKEIIRRLEQIEKRITEIEYRLDTN